MTGVGEAKVRRQVCELLEGEDGQVWETSGGGS